MKSAILGWSGLVVLASGCGMVRVTTSSSVQGFGEPAAPASASATPHAASGARAADAVAPVAEDDAARARDARRAMRQAVRALDVAFDADPSAKLPADKLAELAAFAASKDEALAAYAGYVLAGYRIEEAWQKGDGAGVGLAASVGGSVAVEGMLRGKGAQQLSFKVEPGRCYTVLTHLAAAKSSADKADPLRFTAGAKNQDGSSVQRFRVAAREAPNTSSGKRLGRSRIDGVCAEKATTVTAATTLTYAGSDNGLRYVVLETPKEQLPAFVASNLEVELSDPCDAENWASLWFRPVPGSVVFDGRQPLLVTEPGPNEDAYLHLRTAGFGLAQLKRSEALSTAPKTLSFGGLSQEVRCSRDPAVAVGVDSLKYAQCYARQEARFDPQVAAAEAAKDRAPTWAARQAADARVEQISAAYDAAVERECDPHRDRAVEKMRAVLDRVVDQYAAGAPTPAVDRAKALRRTYEGADRDD